MLPGYNSFRYHMELMQKNICNKLSFNYFYRFFNRNLMICLKTAEQVCHDFDQFFAPECCGGKANLIAKHPIYIYCIFPSIHYNV